MDPFWLHLGLIVFWALYFSVVLLMNALDALNASGSLPAAWKFASGNYARIAEATETYHAPAWLNRALFAGVIAWQALAAGLLWAAAATWIENEKAALPSVNLAFAAGLSLWAAFLLADEIFKEYQSEGEHMQIFAAQLLSLLAIHALG